MRFRIFIAVSLIAFHAHGSPCTGIDRALPESKKVIFAPAIEKHLNQKMMAQISERIAIAPSDILQLFREGRWHVVYVNTHISDEPYLFYSSSPEKSNGYVLDFSGGAAMDEESSMRKWVAANAPGIPRKLAACFAWHVTKARDM
jgi:hypothetical protein